MSAMDRIEGTENGKAVMGSRKREEVVIGARTPQVSSGVENEQAFLSGTLLAYADT